MPAGGPRVSKAACLYPLPQLRWLFAVRLATLQVLAAVLSPCRTGVSVCRYSVR